MVAYQPSAGPWGNLTPSLKIIGRQPILFGTERTPPKENESHPLSPKPRAAKVGFQNEIVQRRVLFPVDESDTRMLCFRPLQ